MPCCLPSARLIFGCCVLLSSSAIVSAQQPVANQQRSELAPNNIVRDHLDPSTISRIEAFHRLQNQRLAPTLDISQFHEPLLDNIMQSPIPELQQVLLWNKAALDMTSLDYTTDNLTPPPPTYGEQYGPPKTARAMAIVHLAIFEAINAIERRYPSYQNLQSQIWASTGLKPNDVTGQTASLDMAIESAAATAISALYPNKQSIMQQMYQTSDVAQITAWMHHAYPASRANAMIAQGTAIGIAAANAVLANRANDGSQIPDLTVAQVQPANPTALTWTTDPLHPGTTALGSSWHKVKPWVITANNQFTIPQPPAPGTDEYRADLAETISLGGDPHAVPSAIRAVTPTARTPEQTFIGTFWAYDATALLCAPPRLYNELVTSIATHEHIVAEPIEMARLLATANITMSDAALVAWTGKYHFLRARPITLIRSLGGEDALWTPLGAPQSNSEDILNFTPPFPTYPSGHATFGGSLFQVLADFYNTPIDAPFPFTFVSDEWNGMNAAADGKIRPLIPQHFTSLYDAEQQNGMSRIYLGIHFQADSDNGIAAGNQTGNYVYSHLFQ